MLACFQAAAGKNMRNALFWFITQQVVLIFTDVSG
jgi:hypothetical protein